MEFVFSELKKKKKKKLDLWRVFQIVEFLRYSSIICSTLYQNSFARIHANFCDRAMFGTS